MATMLLADAGAAYLWAGEGDVGALPLDFESVYAVAADVDFWLNPDSSFWFSVEDVLASDPRYADFAPLVKVDACSTTMPEVNESGGNAYYEEGAAHPEKGAQRPGEDSASAPACRTTNSGFSARFSDLDLATLGRGTGCAGA